MIRGRSRTRALLALVIVGAVVGAATAVSPLWGEGHRAVAKAPADGTYWRIAARFAGLRLTSFEVRSKAVHRTLRALLLQPAAPSARRGLVLFLHADHGTDHTTLSPDLLAALGRLGRRAPAMLFVGGGQRTYWHDRAGARWADYLLHDLLPTALRRVRGDRRRVMVAGISMGAYGALDLARLHPGRFCAVAAHSPVLWRRWHAAERAQPGAFDDRRDFLRHDPLRAAARAPRTFADQPIWLDTGRSDRLAGPGTRTLASTLRRHGVRVALHASWPGGHGGTYWDAHWDAYLRFDAAALRACRH